MTADKLDLTRTRAALAQFDAGKPTRDKMLDDAQTDAEVVTWDVNRHGIRTPFSG